MIKVIHYFIWQSKLIIMIMLKNYYKTNLENILMYSIHNEEHHYH
jgi:hypothetical protein